MSRILKGCVAPSLFFFSVDFRETIRRPSDVADVDGLVAAVSFLNDERNEGQSWWCESKLIEDCSETTASNCTRRPSICNRRHRSPSCELISRRLSDGAPIDKPVIAADKQISSSFARCGILAESTRIDYVRRERCICSIRLGQVELIISSAFDLTAQTERGSSYLGIRHPIALTNASYHNGPRISGKLPHYGFSINCRAFFHLPSKVHDETKSIANHSEFSPEVVPISVSPRGGSE